MLCDCGAGTVSSRATYFTRVSADSRMAWDTYRYTIPIAATVQGGSGRGRGLDANSAFAGL